MRTRRSPDWEAASWGPTISSSISQEAWIYVMDWLPLKMVSRMICLLLKELLCATFRNKQKSTRSTLVWRTDSTRQMMISIQTWPLKRTCSIKEPQKTCRKIIWKSQIASACRRNYWKWASRRYESSREQLLLIKWVREKYHLSNLIPKAETATIVIDWLNNILYFF